MEEEQKDSLLDVEEAKHMKEVVSAFLNYRVSRQY